MRIKPGILNIHLKKFTKEMILDYLESIQSQKVQQNIIDKKLNMIMDEPEESQEVN